MYGEYQIRAALIKTLEQAKADLGIEGFDVIARNPQNITRDDDIILIDKLNTARQGFQCRKYHPDVESGANELKEVMYWQEETTYQISVCRARKVTDGIATFTSDDCVEQVMAWLNSLRGARYMRSGKSGVPFAPVFTKHKRTKAYTDESDVYQMEESFDFRLLVIQELTMRAKAIAVIGFDHYTIIGDEVVKLGSEEFPAAIPVTVYGDG